MAANKDKIRATAQKYLQKGQIDKAVREFERLVEDDPRDVRTLLKIGDLQTRSGKHAEATETYSKVAEFYAGQGFFLKAVAVYKQILKIDPTLVDINLKLAELYHQLGLLSDATNQYRQISQIYEKQGRTDEAMAVLRKMVELDPENVASRIKLADVFAKQEMVEEARNEYRSAAAYLKSHHRVDDYVKVAERIVHFDPADLETTRELANIYIQKNDARRALAKLQVCFKADPKDVNTLTLLANAFRDLGQVQKTISVYRELARIHGDAGDTRAQISVLRQLLELSPDDAEAQHAIKQFGPAQPISRVEPAKKTMEVREVNRTQSGSTPAIPAEPPAQPAEIEVEADEIIASEEPSAADHEEAILRILTEVEVYVKYGLKSKAMEHVQRIFDLEPDHVEARTKYKNLLLDLRDVAGAARELWLLASNAHQGGMLDDARKHLAELFGLDPNHPQARDLQDSLGVSPQAATPDPLRAASVAVNAETLHAEVPTPATPAVVSTPTAPDPIVATPELEVFVDEDVPSVTLSGAPPGPTLSYEPSPAAAEIDLDADDEDDIAMDVEVDDEPIDIEVEADEPDLLLGVENGVESADVGVDETGLILDEAPAVVVPPAADHTPATVESGEGRVFTGVDKSPVQSGEAQLPVSVETRATEDADVQSGESAMPEQLGRGSLGVSAAPISSAHTQSGTSTTNLDVVESKGIRPSPLDDELEALLSSVPKPRVKVAVEPEPEIEVKTADEPEATVEDADEPEVAAELEVAVEDAEEPEVAAELEVAVEDAEEPEVAAELEVAVEDADEPEVAVEVAVEPEVAAGPEPEVAQELPDLSDEIEEIHFFLQQGLENEAEDSLTALLLSYPTHPELLALRAELDGATQAPGPEPEPESEPESEPEPEPVVSAPDDFDEPEPDIEYETVDLAADLEAELGDTDVDDFQVSFADVFDEFKKGVAQQVEDTDYDTHYDLGIAYKEMGLFDDATREFLLSTKSAERAIGALTMVGLCKLEQGSTEEALEHFQSGLNSEHVTPEEAMALRYEIGLAYYSMGKFAEAAKFFDKVHTMNAQFRDVGAKLDETRRLGGESGVASSELDALLDETQAEKQARQEKSGKISYL